MPIALCYCSSDKGLFLPYITRATLRLPLLKEDVWLVHLLMAGQGPSSYELALTPGQLCGAGRCALQAHPPPQLPWLPCRRFSSVALYQDLLGSWLKTHTVCLLYQWNPDSWDGTRDAFSVLSELPRSTEERAASISPQGMAGSSEQW